MIKIYAIKDTNTGEYTRNGGRGWRDPYMTPDIYLANTYSAKGPATTFINQYNEEMSKPNTYPANKIPVLKNLRVVTIQVHYQEK